MKTNNLILFLIPIIFSSCASILNRKTQKINLIYGKQISAVTIPQKAQLVYNKSYEVERSSEFLKLNFSQDSIKKTVYVKPHYSLAYWGNLSFGFMGLVGILIDKDQPKSYAYPRQIDLNQVDSNSSIILKTPNVPRKNTVRGSFSFGPVGGFVHLNTPDGNQRIHFLFSAESGIEYFIKKNQFLSFNAGYALGNSHNGPQDHRNVSTHYFSVLHNRLLKKGSIGFGINSTNYKWTHYINTFAADTAYSIKTAKLGACINGQLKISDNFSLKGMYQANVLSRSFTSDKNYHDLVSFGLTYKFIVNLKRRNDME